MTAEVRILDKHPIFEAMMDKSNKILKACMKAEAAEPAYEWLSQVLSAAELNSVLLSVFEERLKGQSSSDVLAQYNNNRFSKPSVDDARQLARWELYAYDLASPFFEAMVLSPVAPLGTCSSMAAVHQNNVLTALRQCEVVADPTNVMAMEMAAAHRKQDLPFQNRHLCTSHRLLRTSWIQKAGFTSHFQIFSLASGGLDTGHHAFEMHTMEAHIRFYLTALQTWILPNHSMEVIVTDFSKRMTAAIEKTLFKPMTETFPTVRFRMGPERERGRNYYDPLCFEIRLHDGDREYSLVDGGFTPWLAQLLGNRKLRFLGSGLGVSRMLPLCRKRVSEA